MVSFRDQVYKYVVEKYKSKIEYLWFRYPNYAVFRNQTNNKWYALIMDIPYNKLGIEKEGIVDVLNVKVADSILKDFLIHQDGIFKGYHIARGNWITILLDGTVNIEEILNLIDESFNLVNNKK